MKISGIGSAFGLATGLAAIVGLTAPAMAQCTGDPSGAIQDNDDQVCGNTTPDANGGCNVSPVAFQSLGVLAPFQTLKVAGKAGTYGPTNGTRDLDWYSFTVSAPTKVTISMAINTPAQESIIQVIEGDCDGTILATSQLVGCNSVPADGNGIYCEPGVTYIFLVTAPFPAAQGPEHACSDYLIDISTTDSDSGCNGVPANRRCDGPHPNGQGGCEDFQCCNEVIFGFPNCAVTWDQSCANQAQTLCADYLFYNCTSPVGAPTNDCVANATNLTIDAAAVNFTTVNAGLDGWKVNNCQPTPNSFVRDVWAKVTAPASGNLLTAVAGTGLTGTVEFYNLGSTPLTDPQAQLPGAYIGCLTLAAAGNVVEVAGLAANDTVYIRYADQGVADTFTIETGFVFVVFDTGPQSFVVFNGANTNLGLSSGDVTATLLQRWIATPFTVPAAPAGFSSWLVTDAVVKGFLAAAPNTVETLNWVVWERTGFTVPVDGDQVASGSVPLPTPFDDPADNFANGAWALDFGAGFELAPGDYYFTCYGADATAPGQNISNWAWFLYANNGINMLDANNNPFTWRSVTFPTPGFVLYQAAAIQFPTPAPIEGSDAKDLYNVAFRINGIPAGDAPVECVGDFNLDGLVEGADLAILLGGWGGPAGDLNGDGTTEGADLAILLGAWGTCPG